MKKYAAGLLVIFLIGCVSAPPYLTEEQEKKVSTIKIYNAGEKQKNGFTIIAEVKAADCTGEYGTRIKGQELLAIEKLKAKAVTLGADAILDGSCSYAPFVNNCWAAAVCDGKAAILK